ncbi:hypothetical protein ACS0TY_000932 [Phlomoides rotata]
MEVITEAKSAQDREQCHVGEFSTESDSVNSVKLSRVLDLGRTRKYSKNGVEGKHSIATKRRENEPNQARCQGRATRLNSRKWLSSEIWRNRGGSTNPHTKSIKEIPPQEPKLKTEPVCTDRKIRQRFDIEKFSGKSDFGLWRIKMKALLVHQGLADALKDDSSSDEEESSSTQAERAKMMEKAHSAIILCLGDKALREVSKESTARGVWDKLESLYMVKTLANRYEAEAVCIQDG